MRIEQAVFQHPGRAAQEGAMARRWQTERFGVEDAEPFRESASKAFEERLEEAGDDPRVLAAEAAMAAAGFTMEPGQEYTPGQK